jgi:hypothetical protein
MKIQKLILIIAVIAVACGGICLSTLVRAQNGAPASQTTPSDPDANKKEAPASAYASPTPTPAPKK